MLPHRESAKACCACLQKQYPPRPPLMTFKTRTVPLVYRQRVRRFACTRRRAQRTYVRCAPRRVHVPRSECLGQGSSHKSRAPGAGNSASRKSRPPKRTPPPFPHHHSSTCTRVEGTRGGRLRFRPPPPPPPSCTPMRQYSLLPTNVRNHASKSMSTPAPSGCEKLPGGRMAPQTPPAEGLWARVGGKRDRGGGRDFR